MEINLYTHTHTHGVILVSWCHMDHYNNDFDGLVLVGKRKVAKLLVSRLGRAWRGDRISGPQLAPQNLNGPHESNGDLSLSVKSRRPFNSFGIKFKPQQCVGLQALVSGPLLLSTEAAKKPTFYVKILGPLVTYSIEERPCSIDIWSFPNSVDTIV